MHLYHRLICWLTHRRTWKLMAVPHGRVQVWEWGCRRCPEKWYHADTSRATRRIKRS